ncbi:MAG TPA: heparan-alpha-glucosaminide N-acetyltransferase domain-containing protein [Anaerolineae bacterium]|nr:heparan-alpha-glucosaminide N-acetyltransferase domain-containing protein [Anaerolineae bacterium]HOR00527.1 heparan-alpha-glucosaminide N-acetyltransferase domain-containing protein [Anaerolineae bacterium]HPL27527.1 heparan-alpha-glucosaminide N-acetyltransferase domain-containing protein [Anaerolineae bacterium]
MKATVAEARSSTERRLELDIAKGLAVLLMICVHVQEMYSLPEVQHSAFGYAVELITTFPAAPLFMFMMGVGLVYSRRQSAGYALKRGLLLLLAAYLLNALRGFVPWTLGIQAGLVDSEAVPYGDVVLSLLEVDILHLAGLSLILVAGLRAVRAHWSVYPVIGVLLAALNYLVRGFSTGQPVADALVGLIWGTSETTYFPFLSWAFYPLAGVAFGTMLRRYRDTRRLYLWTLFAGAVTFLITSAIGGFNLLYYMGITAPYAYYHLDLVGLAFHGSLMLVWLAGLYLLQSVFPAAVTNKLLFWSREVTPIYFIHWVLIGWFILLVGFNQLSYWQSILAMALTVVAADRLATAYANWQQSRRASKTLADPSGAS